MFFTKFTFVFIYSNGWLETILGIFNFIDSILYVQTIFFLPILIIFITILALAALPNKNYLLYLVCLEFIVAGLNLGFIFVTILNSDPQALAYAAFILGIAAAEVALGIAIILVVYDKRMMITVSSD